MTTSATVEDCLAVIAEFTAKDWAVVALATIEGKRDRAQPVADALGVRLQVWPGARLASVVVPDPSDRVRAETGTPSVAEAAAILTSSGGELILGKTRSRGVTIAAACIID